MDLFRGTCEPVPVEIRPNHLDDDRYHGFVGMLKMISHDTQGEELIIIQRLFENPFSIPEQDFKWKTISINKEGVVKTDTFTRESIDDPSYRRDFIHKSTVSPFALGYKSNVLHVYPSLFYPLFYPFGTAGLGGILLVLGILFRKRDKKV